MTSPGHGKHGLRRGVRVARRERSQRGGARAGAEEAGDATAERELAGLLADAAAPLWEGLPRGTLVAAYRARRDEPPTAEVVRRARADGIRVIVPELLGDGDLDWHEVGSGAGDRAGSVAADGPALGREVVAQVPLLLVPALLVDRRGTRLGQGGGSYDRALARRSTQAVVVALLWDGELVEGPLPAEPHDAPVDAVITPSGGLVHLR